MSEPLNSGRPRTRSDQDRTGGAREENEAGADAHGALAAGVYASDSTSSAGSAVSDPLTKLALCCSAWQTAQVFDPTEWSRSASEWWIRDSCSTPPSARTSTRASATSLSLETDRRGSMANTISGRGMAGRFFHTLPQLSSFRKHVAGSPCLWHNPAP